VAEETNNAGICEINRFTPIPKGPKGKKVYNRPGISTKIKRKGCFIKTKSVRWSTIADTPNLEEQKKKGYLGRNRSEQPIYKQGVERQER
jgi:hypothetical protein